MPQLTQPVTQKWYTNVTLVTLTVGQTPFEIACYSNKTMAFRNGLESDLSEVLQSTEVYSDAVHGIAHSEETLLKAFGTSNRLEVCREILRRGRMQQSTLERRTEGERRVREIASLVSSRTRNPVTSLPYPEELVLYVMKNKLHYSLNDQPVSAQAAFVTRKISEIAPLEMRPLEATIELDTLRSVECLEGIASVIPKEDLTLHGMPFIDETRTVLKCDVSATSFATLQKAVRAAGGTVSLPKTFALRLK